jgi:pSer/pThr/pTyr-binding forkhead associated (FHA) protein
VPGERRLLVTEGDRQREVLLVGAVTVGRGPLCEISSPDPRLSREHAVFETADDGVRVRDLNSRNGTRVNGALITEHRLTPNDVVEVGPFVVRLADAPALAARVADSPLGNEDATVMMPLRVAAPPGGAPAPPDRAAMPAGSPPDEDPEATRLTPRRPTAPPVATGAPAAPAAPPAAAPPAAPPVAPLAGPTPLAPPIPP